MKNQFTSRIVKFTFALMFILIASSCSQDDEAMDAAALAQENTELAAKGAKVEATVVYTSSITGYESDVCVNTEQTFTLSGWKDDAQLNVQIYDKDLSDWVSIDSFTGQLTSPQSLSYTFPAVGVYLLRYQVSGKADNGGTNGTVEFNVLVVDCSSCDEANFTYETTDNQNITFTYNHGEEVSSVTIAFTIPQVENSILNGDGKYVGADGKFYDVNNATNQTVFTWTGEVSCKSDEAETFEFSFTPDCSAPPSNDGQALVWTDANIVAIDGIALVDDLLTTEDESEINLKEINNLSNIVYTGCPKKN